MVLVVALAACVSINLPAQDAKPATAPAQPKPVSAPTPGPPNLLDRQHEAERLRLREPQLLFFMAQKDIENAAGKFSAVCAQIAAEEKWPPGTQCNIQNLAVMFPAPADPSSLNSEPKKVK
jgi:hypothetical protein